ncbi:MAG: hypothetical protein ABIX01_18765 [Chitinophagaceae bacterium]
MKPKRWILFTIAVYLSLALALLTGVFAIYLLLNSGRISVEDWTYFILIMTVPVIQLSFQLMNAWLLHKSISKPAPPNTRFRICHTLLLTLNALCVFCFCLVLVEVISTLKQMGPGVSPFDITWQKTMMISCIINILANIRTILDSLKFRYFLRLHHKANEEQLLNSIGRGETSL